MKSIVNIILFVSLAILYCPHPSSSTTYTGSWTNSDSTWSASWTNNGDTITAVVECRTTGWCAMGFGNVTEMPYSDIYWCSFDNTYCPTGCFIDRWATEYAHPDADIHQDITKISASMSNGIFTYSYSRKLITGDPNGQDIPIIASGTVYMKWAVGQQDDIGIPDGNGDFSFMQHQDSGYQLINFFTNSQGQTTGLVGTTTASSTTTGTSTGTSTTGAGTTTGTGSSSILSNWISLFL